MRIFTTQLVTETNTFAPIPSGRRAYEEMGIHQGDASRVAPDGVFGTLALWRGLAEAQGHEVVEGLAAQAQPGGRTLKAVYEGFRAKVLRAIAAAPTLDAVLLNLHGAMSAEGYDDCEGDLLEEIRRAVGPSVAIGVELDLHCHLTTRMLRAADIIVAYKHYPHTDIADRAREVLELTLATAAGRIKPVISVADCHMVGLWHTTREPMASFVRSMEACQDGKEVLSVSLGHGFPWGDVAEAGAKLWVITDGRPALGEPLALDLANRFFQIRKDTVQPLLSIDQVLDKVTRSDVFPIVGADGADNPGGGAPSDSTFVLQRILDRGLEGALIAFFYDPEAVRVLSDAGVGATLDMRIGGKTGPASGAPVDLRVQVRQVIPDHYQTGLGLRWPLGATVWVRGPHDLDLVLTSARSQAFDPVCLQQLGIDLSRKRLIVVKSIQHFYALFAPIARGGVLYIAAPGALTPDFANIPYQVKSLDYWPRRDDVTPEIINY
ncbi:M81 family metallopeptidase [Nitrospirillum viridazoti]|uniref:Microcystinase C n=1 Tax=Nitrospirillum viridazoti CBAmc TaxID=1441467 RepID=A0A248K0R8_9PROT|nr:M81 family metallopeptidase [Nitrospirillum amazonense]ASG24410.1 microcystin LR degradation protein MlrC-like protein [Nitrospirillum amazonense CBAmc]TWB33368.1 microcystin degradation protein MlrC [Nitrospirillum amazonense]